MNIDIKHLREHLTSGKRFEIYGEGTSAAAAVLNAAPDLLNEIERLDKQNKALSAALHDYAPCGTCDNQMGNVCDYCDDTHDKWRFAEWQWHRKDKS